MPELKFHKDGRVTLPSNADPAAAGTRVEGWRRHVVGLDLGRNDPTALVVVRDECYPEFSGRGFEQVLGPRRATVVHQETVQLYAYTDLADYELAADALAGSLFRMLRQGQRVIFDLDDDGRATALRLGSEIDMGTPGHA